MIKTIRTSVFGNLSLLASVFLLLAASPASAQLAKPILEFTFNGSGNNETSTGTSAVTGAFRNFGGQNTNLHSASGLGVSGLAGDLAFNNTASTRMGGTQSNPGQGGVFSASNAHGNLSAFTISGWYNGVSAPGSGAILLNGKINLRITSGGLSLDVSGSSVVSEADSIYRTANVWTFFAITFDPGIENNNVTFYAGTSAQDVRLVGTHTLAYSDSVVPGGDLAIGNLSNSRNRPFDGYMDNFRLWGSVLDLDDLGIVRAADLSNSQIPEASTYAMLVSIACLTIVSLLRRRAKN